MSPDLYSYPKLRWPIETRLEEFQGQKVLLLMCPLGVVREPLALVAAVGPLLARFDGQTKVEEIVKEYAEHGVTTELLYEIIKLLDDNLFLDSPRFHEAEAAWRKNFADKKTRPSSLAGLGYPAEPEALTTLLESYLAVPSQARLPEDGRLLGIMAPHIDYQRGGPCYGLTYQHLNGTADSPLYILFGTAHQYSPGLFHFTRKDFETPFGTLVTDQEFLDQFVQKTGDDKLFHDEILHQKEHSLELQLPFLAYHDRSATIIPVLVGSFYQMLTSGNLPENFPEYERIVDNLSAVLEQQLSTGRKACFIAGVDMAHVGAYFGDAGSLTKERLAEVEARDRMYLQHLQEQDKQALFAHIAEDSDDRKVCGFPTMYTLIDIFDRLGVSYEACLYDYRQSVNYENDCAVTYAGMGFYSGS